MTNRLAPGKVPWDVVADLVSGSLPPEVKLGPAIGEDAALVEIGGELWAVAADPVSFTAADAGRLAVVINANDVAVRGARPQFFLAVGLIAPHEATNERVRDLLQQVRQCCREVGATLIGGHTEVTPGLPHSMVIGTMLGKVDRRPLTTGGLRPGDLVGMTRSAGLEGTAILLAEHGEKLRTLHGDEAVFREEAEFSNDCLLVVPEALAAAGCESVSALHDVTEGGVGEALFEMTQASGLAIEARREDIPVLPITATLCEEFGIDPLGLIGSGSILIGCDPDGRLKIEEIFADLGVPLAWIGHAVAAEDDASTPLPRFSRDELLKTRAMEGVQAIIFDMDGTLIDSQYDWPAIRARLGVEGASIVEDLNALPEPDRSRRWAELEAIERNASEAATLHDGVGELLDLVRRHGILTALVTNNTDANARDLVERFGLEIDLVLTRDSGLYKPSGAPITEAVRRLGLEPSCCFGVGDSRYDFLAAREAALAGACIVNGESHELASAADLAFPDIRSFVRFLEIVLG